MKSLILAVALLLSSQANAGIHPLHYIKTHKSLLASDAVILGSSLAESYTSVACTDAPKSLTRLGQQPPPKGDGLFVRTSNASVD